MTVISGLVSTKSVTGAALRLIIERLVRMVTYKNTIHQYCFIMRQKVLNTIMKILKLVPLIID